MVNASIPREPQLYLHFDGEFASSVDLVRDTITGRNFGWLVPERATAIRHVAHIIRQDDGTGQLAAEFGGSYRRVLLGTDPDIPDLFRLPSEYRLDVSNASDEKVLDAVSHLSGDESIPPHAGRWTRGSLLQSTSVGHHQRPTGAEIHRTWRPFSLPIIVATFSLWSGRTGGSENILHPR
jgi:hypothetical protein